MSMHEQFRLWNKYQTAFAQVVSVYISDCYPTYNKTKIDPVPNGYLVRMYSYEDEEVFNKVFPKDLIDKSYDTCTFESVIEWYNKEVSLQKERNRSVRLQQAFNLLHISKVSIEDYTKLKSLKEESRKKFFDNFVQGK